jgi:CDP-6-deoxy-D-xylo-4-hexulose-3-dehydrase
MEFQAALGVSQLRKAQRIFSRRSANVRFLNKGLADLAGILVLPEHSAQVSYLAYPLLVKEGSGVSRKFLRAELEKRGIETRPLFGCIPLQQPAYAAYAQAYAHLLPNAERAGANGFYIGCHQYLSAADLRYIVTVFHTILR